VSRRPASRRARNVIGIVIVSAVTIYGAVLLGLGISGLVNENALASGGVSTFARVTATSGYGNDAVQVTYLAGIREVQGTVGVQPSSVYVGEVLPVVYDPGNPQVVSLSSDAGDTSSAWAEVIPGAIFVSLVPLSVLTGVLSRRRRRRRLIRGALGE
jgi:hypothetical protein